MSDRSRRPSTVKSTENQEERSRLRREIKASKQISAKLSQLIELEEAELEESEEDFQNIAETVLSDKPATPAEKEPESTDLGATGGFPREVQEVLEIEIDSDDSNLFEDPLGAVRTPSKDSNQTIKSPEIPLGQSHSIDPDNWSQANQFFPAGCQYTPLVPRQEISSVTSNSSETAAPVLSLPSVLHLDEQDQTNPTPSSNSLPAMEETLLNGRLRQVEKAGQKVSERIGDFQAEDVTLADKDTFRGYIEDTKTLLDTFRSLSFDLRSELNLEDSKDKVAINTLKVAEENLQKLFRKNAKQVKEAIVQLIDQNETSRPVSASEAREKDKEERLAREKKERVELKMRNITKKCTELTNIIDTVDEPQGMTENEVRENLLESKDWQRTANELRKQKEIIEEEMIGQPVDAEIKTEFEQKTEDMMDSVSQMVKDLKLQDKERGLYTLAPAKTKEKVVYPEPYSGDTGVNVFKFVTDLKDAIAADQVRKSDQIKTLRKFLKGDAKQVVGEHYTDLEKALAALTKAFGNPTLIWKRLFEDLKKALGNYDNWGKKKNKQETDCNM